MPSSAMLGNSNAVVAELSTHLLDRLRLRGGSPVDQTEPVQEVGRELGDDGVRVPDITSSRPTSWTGSVWSTGPPRPDRAGPEVVELGDARELERP